VKAIAIALFVLPASCATTPPPCRCPQPPAIPAAEPAGEERPLDLAGVFDSVVQIKVKVAEKMSRGKVEESFEYGTGFFVDGRGTILTSAHVLAAADDPRKVTVYVAGRPMQARLGPLYREVDLATLLVDAGKTRPLALSLRKPGLGEAVYAVGFPYVDIFSDKQPAISAGHVAGTGRKIEYEGRPVKDLLLTDAFVADGCSGGPLLDGRGEVIGVLRFNLSKEGSWLGLSFAEPIGSYLDREGKTK
jgi:S1-C subfamily serine protease